MKHIQKKFFLFAAMAASVIAPAEAQEPVENIADSLAAADEVQVAFRTVAKEDLLGGVSVVNMRELLEKNYNTNSMDNMQGYIGGWNGSSLWGMEKEYLALVDGVPRDFNNIKPEEIESVTFLKGAQAVILYGSRAAKGAILITTKRGKTDDIKIEVRANTGWNVAKAYPEYIGSAEYMTLYNEALVNDGKDPKFSEMDIYNYGSGQNPYRYPNLNFYSDEYIKKAYNRSSITAEISGGGKRASYYSNVSYFREGTQLNFGDAKNNYTDRFDVRGNVDLNISEMIKAYINANVTFYNKREPSSGNYWETAATYRPNRVAPLIPVDCIDPNAEGALDFIKNTHNIFDGCFLGGITANEETNIFADYYAIGKSTFTSRKFQFDAGVNFVLDKVLKGLSFHTQFAMDYATEYKTSYKNEYATFEPVWSSYNGKECIIGLVKNGNDKKSGVQNIGDSKDNQIMLFNAHFDYNRSFGDHNVSAILLANGYQQTYSGQYHAVSNANLALQASYNFAKKYYLEAGASMVHSAKFPKNNREKMSMSATLGWNLAKESFMEGSAFDELMLSVSGSVLESDMYIGDMENGTFKDKYYMYSSIFNQSEGGWWGWFDGQSLHATDAKQGENLDLTFIERKELSANLRASLWNHKLTADLSFFTSSVEGKIIKAVSAYPSYFIRESASFVPYMNNDNDGRIGFDAAINYKEKYGEVDISAGVAATYYKVKATKRDDSLYEDTYQYRQDKDIDALWGYRCLGFFNSDEEASIYADLHEYQIGGGTPKAGDLKYQDVNNDNKIDEKDKVFLGRTGEYGAPLTLGLNFTAKYKNVTLFVLGTAGFGGYAMKKDAYWWVYGENKYSAVVRDRWTPETAKTATYPRLTTGNGNNNFTESDFWMYKTDRIDLAKVQLTYDFQMNGQVVKGLSAYISGSNLLTISKERDILEMNVSSAPQNRFYNLGMKVTF